MSSSSLFVLFGSACLLFTDLFLLPHDSTDSRPQSQTACKELEFCFATLLYLFGILHCTIRTGSHGPKQYFTLHWNITPYDSVNLKASYMDCNPFPSGPKDGKILGSTGHLRNKNWAKSGQRNHLRLSKARSNSPFIINDLKRAFWVFCHRNTTSGKDTIGGWKFERKIHQARFLNFLKFLFK